ncbi:MAG: hypothetical protein FJW27_02960 [Acidimicrobiia bacterium]|nr:hypothetical protein [Acidimicrobiia bacterium]
MIQIASLFLLALLFVGCREDRLRSGSQTLSDPPKSYPSNGASTAPPKDPETAGRGEPKPKPKSETVWERLGSWSGKQSIQTESFTGLTGALRVKWEAKGPADGTFQLTIHSSISGRPLQVAVDQKGPGADTAYVNEDPRVFFAVIEAKNMEWSFTVDEAMGTKAVQ